jgi:hypothetical protein
MTPLSPGKKGKRAIEYERIQSTIRKNRLYKFIQVPYSQPLLRCIFARDSVGDCHN